MNSFSIVSPEKYGFNLCPLTLKVWKVSLHTSTAPCRKIRVTLKGLDHLGLNFPGNSFSLELNSKTRSPFLISLLIMCLSCQRWVLSLKILAFSLASCLISSNSLSCKSLFSLAAFKSKFRV